ncbi:hypothetical protein Syun_003319 [Stephania yunnanensis]|uniref:Brix domain-containing protein n=1 Tax=Stephania yunnanensis TaxID=152371 RepID=A0AAP0L0W9_9MAGN
MLRRNIRLRREYLYRKSLEGKERLLYEKKRKIKEALEDGKAIPTELVNEEAALRQEIDLEDEHTAVPKTHIDDEYANAAEKDPKILLTTSRDPSSRLTQFVKVYILSFLLDVILVHEHRGEPDGLIVCHLPFGPTAYFGLLNVVTRHDIKDKKSMGTMPEVYPHLILNNFTTKLGERTANILKHLFPVPKLDSRRIITFANQSDYISFRHHIYEKHGGPKAVDLKEIGPRFEMRLYQIKLGTVDQNEAQNEWVIRPYMNTAKKHNVLSTAHPIGFWRSVSEVSPRLVPDLKVGRTLEWQSHWPREREAKEEQDDCEAPLLVGICEEEVDDGSLGPKNPQKALIEEEMKRQVKLAGPLMSVNFLMYSVQVISVMFVGHLGELPLSGASMATSFASVTGFSLLVIDILSHSLKRVIS